MGQKEKKPKTHKIVGKNSLIMNLNELTPGIYQMKVTVGDQTQVVKVVKY